MHCDELDSNCTAGDKRSARMGLEKQVRGCLRQQQQPRPYPGLAVLVGGLSNELPAGISAPARSPF